MINILLYLHIHAYIFFWIVSSWVREKENERKREKREKRKNENSNGRNQRRKEGLVSWMVLYLVDSFAFQPFIYPFVRLAFVNSSFITVNERLSLFRACHSALYNVGSKCIREFSLIVEPRETEEPRVPLSILRCTYVRTIIRQL